MTTLNVPDDEPIQANIISGIIESAQAKIEGFNFDSRHRLLEYDDVMNKHREIIYKRRREILEMPIEDLRSKVMEITKIAGFTEEEYHKKEEELGGENMRQVEKFVSLKVIDTLWQDHLSNMEHMRDSVGLRAYGGKDPLVEYKNEGRRLFSQLLNEIDQEIAQNIFSAKIQAPHQPQYQQPRVVQQLANNKQGDARENIGRNDPCWCGSGKKFKRCHGI